MPWRERTVNQMREEFVLRALNQEKSKAALCREYGISRPTGDKWIKRYMDGEELDDQDRTPHTIVRTPTEIEEKIIGLRKQHPAIGAAKLRQILINRGETGVPCAKTVNNILNRNGLITEEASKAATPYRRFSRDEPNQMWQADFKGHFKMANGERSHPLNIIDDHSRMNLCCEPMSGETFGEMQPILIGIFKEYGLPFSFLCDNGPPWGTSQYPRFTHMEVWFMDLGVLVLHGRPLHPQTQGKEERFNQSMTRELLDHTTILDKEDARGKFKGYQAFYNYERPHCALNMDVPAKHYVPSDRKYPERIEPWEYPRECKLRKVKSTGFFSWNNHEYFLSEAFGDKMIAVRESHEAGHISLFYRQFRIGRLNIEKGEYVFRRSYLVDGDPRRNKG